MRILFRIVLVLVVLAVAFLGAGFLLPAHRETIASVLIDAPAATIYPKVAGFKDGWASWSPFGKAEDPEMVLSFEGPDTGVGARQRWKSKKMPEGTMTITRADPEHGVAYELEMPEFRLAGHIDFEQHPTSTQVTWTDGYDLGRSPIQRWMGVMIDQMMGPKLQQGLNELKRQVEQKPR